MEEAAAAEVEQWLLFIIAVANRAVIFLLPPLEFEAIVSQRGTFVNEENTTDSNMKFCIFCAYSLNGPYSPSRTVLQAPRTWAITGTQVLAP